ncbi:MAG: SdpI family protein [Candidatus Buchananbacteria bacterium]
MNPVKPTFKTEVIPIIAILLSVLASFYFYANFPDLVPTHWNYRGEIDGYAPKLFGAFFFPALIIGIYLFFLFLPYLDPQKNRYQEFAKVYHTFKTLIVLFMVFIYFFTGLAGLGYPAPVNIVVPIGVGILFLVLGNYLGKIKPNWFMGIRTPWTMSNEEVWNKTHRLGGKIFMLIGLFMIFGTILPATWFFISFMAVVIIGSLIPIFYSYWLFKKITNK